MPGLRARVQRDEHSGAWRPDSIGKEGKSPAVKERSLQTPQGGRMPHDSLPFPEVRSRGPADLGRLGRLSSAPQVPLPTWTQLLGTLKCYYPQVASWSRARRCEVCTPIPQPSAPVLHGHPTRPQPNPSRAPTRSATLLPTSPRRCDPIPPGSRLPGRSPGCSDRREAGGASRGPSGSGRAGAGGGHSAPRGIVSKIRPLGASRKQLMRPRLRGVTPTAGQW